MRTSMNIPDEPLKEVKTLAKTETTTQAVILAISEFIQRQKLKKIKELQGTMDPHYDYKKFRGKK